MSEGLCPAHSGMVANVENVTRQTESNTQEIKTLSEAVMKLTFIAEELKAEKERQALQPAPKKESFWNTKAGEKVPLFMFLAFIILVAALVGTNLLEAFQATQAIPVK